jgi:hypothetical protein
MQKVSNVIDWSKAPFSPEEVKALRDYLDYGKLPWAQLLGLLKGYFWSGYSTDQWEWLKNRLPISATGTRDAVCSWTYKRLRTWGEHLEKTAADLKKLEAKLAKEAADLRDQYSEAKEVPGMKKPWEAESVWSMHVDGAGMYYISFGRDEEDLVKSCLEKFGGVQFKHPNGSIRVYPPGTEFVDTDLFELFKEAMENLKFNAPDAAEELRNKGD